MALKKKRKVTKKSGKKRLRTRKKTAARRKKKAALPDVNMPVSAVRDKMTQSQLLSAIAEASDLDKKKVKEVLECLSVVAHRHLKKGGAGAFKVPFLNINLKRVVKPARKARKGINPFTGEAMTFKAKPKSTVVRARALKALKESIS